MATCTPRLLISVLFCLLSVASALGASDVPFIVAHKKTSLTRLKSGVERLSVSVDIYNQGSSTAYDLSLSDENWPQDVFDVITGSTSKTWERLDAGGLLSHSFELEAKAKGMFQSSPAVVTFRIPNKAALQEAFSTPQQPLDILAERPPERKFEWAKKLLVKYGSQISVITIVVLFVYVLVTPSKPSAAKLSKKKR